MIKITTSQLKNLIKREVYNILNEQIVKEGGPGSGQKGHTTKEEPKQKKSKNVFNDKIKDDISRLDKEIGNNSFRYIQQMSDGSININTYAGSSNKGAIKKIFKKLGLDKTYDVDDIDFFNVGNEHDYYIKKL
jgi:hypothetical protein